MSDHQDKGTTGNPRPFVPRLSPTATAVHKRQMSETSPSVMTPNASGGGRIFIATADANEGSTASSSSVVVSAAGSGGSSRTRRIPVRAEVPGMATPRLHSARGGAAAGGGSRQSQSPRTVRSVSSAAAGRGGSDQSGAGAGGGKTPRRHVAFDPAIHAHRYPSGSSRRFCFVLALSILFSIMIAAFGFKMLMRNKRSGLSEAAGLLGEDGAPLAGPFVDALVKNADQFDEKCRGVVLTIQGPPEHPPQGSAAAEVLEVPFEFQESLNAVPWLPVSTIEIILRSKCFSAAAAAAAAAREINMKDGASHGTAAAAPLQIAISKFNAYETAFRAGVINTPYVHRPSTSSSSQTKKWQALDEEVAAYFEVEIERLLGMRNKKETKKEPSTTAADASTPTAESPSSPSSSSFSVVLVDPPVELSSLYRGSPSSSSSTGGGSETKKGNSIVWPAGLAGSLVDSFPARAFAAAAAAASTSKPSAHHHHRLLLFLHHKAVFHRVPIGRQPRPQSQHQHQHSSNWNSAGIPTTSSSSSSVDLTNQADFFMWSSLLPSEDAPLSPHVTIPHFQACQVVKRRSDDHSAEVVSNGIAIECGAGTGSSCESVREQAVLVEQRRGGWATLQRGFRTRSEEEKEAAASHNSTSTQKKAAATGLFGFSPLCFVANLRSPLVRRMVQQNTLLDDSTTTANDDTNEDDQVNGDGSSLVLPLPDLSPEDQQLRDRLLTSWQKLSRAVAHIDALPPRLLAQKLSHLEHTLFAAKDFLGVAGRWVKGSLAHGCGGHRLQAHIPAAAVFVPEVELEALKADMAEQLGVDADNVAPNGEEQMSTSELTQLLREASGAFNLVLRSPCTSEQQRPFLRTTLEFLELLSGGGGGPASSSSSSSHSNVVVVVASLATVVIPSSTINDAPLGTYYPSRARESSFFTKNLNHNFPGKPYSTAPQVGQMRLTEALGGGSLGINPSQLFKKLSQFFTESKANAAALGAAEAIDSARKVSAEEVKELEALQGRHHGTVNDFLNAIRVTWAGYCCSCCGFSNEIASLVVPLAHVIDIKSTLGVDCHCPGIADSDQSVIIRETTMRKPSIASSCRNGEVGRHVEEKKKASNGNDDENDDTARRQGCKNAIDDETLLTAQALTSTLHSHGYNVDPHLLSQHNLGPKPNRRTLAPINVRIVHMDPLTASRYIWRETLPEYVIYRSMTEVTKVPKSWVEILNENADEVWAPSRFVRDAFVNSGVFPFKVHVVPEPVDTETYSPSAPVLPVKFPLGSNRGQEAKWRNADLHGDKCPTVFDLSETHFNFFSNFKWEARKGWVELFAAYFRQFTCKDDVVLTVATYFFSDDDSTDVGNNKNQQQRRHRPIEDGVDSDPADFFHEDELHIDSRDPHTILKMIQTHVVEKLVTEGATMIHSEEKFDPKYLPRVVIITEELRQESLMRLYKTADAFVLPTRGEGWGLPIAQAMSVALPTIVTQHGGHMDFVNEDVVALVETTLTSVRGTEDRDGKMWGVADVASLGSKMAHVFKNREQSKAMGARAREHVAQHFCPECVRSKVLARLAKVGQLVEQRRIDLNSYYVRRLVRLNEKRESE